MKDSYDTLIDRYLNGLSVIGCPGTLWRHKGGDIYEVLGLDVDSDNGTLRVRYKVRVSKEVAPCARNPIVFSRPIAEWTKDRFTPLA